mmetsp:Transcript_5555/g.13660  ORF Transcript_5555/g.13660 Transcript_5555/m.13660 type:complete len:227 (-) Transcript_5555:741-1421(-)
MKNPPAKKVSTECHLQLRAACGSSLTPCASFISLNPTGSITACAHCGTEIGCTMLKNISEESARVTRTETASPRYTHPYGSLKTVSCRVPTHTRVSSLIAAATVRSTSVATSHCTCRKRYAVIVRVPALVKNGTRWYGSTSKVMSVIRATYAWYASTQPKSGRRSGKGKRARSLIFPPLCTQPSPETPRMPHGSWWRTAVTASCATSTATPQQRMATTAPWCASAN